MSFTSIPPESIAVGKPVKAELVQTISDNLEDLNSRIGGVETVAGAVVLHNNLIKKERDLVPVGTIVHSVLTESQFNSETDDGTWQLVNGVASATTDDIYAARGDSTQIPDLRGRFLRMKSHSSGHDPSGDVALDTYQADWGIAHTHTISNHHHDMRHVHQIYHRNSTGQGWMVPQASKSTGLTSFDDSDVSFNMAGRGNAGDDGITSPWFLSAVATTRNFYSAGVIDSPSGSGNTAKTSTQQDASGNQTTSSHGTGTEVRPKGVVSNAFIKTNRNWIKAKDGYLLFRATQNLTINQVVVAPVGQGTAGALVIDVKKGALDSLDTSIFDANPTLAFDDVAPVSGSINATNAAVSAGEYIRVDLVSVQAKLGEFHLLISASPTA